MKEYYHLTDNPLKLIFDKQAISYGKAFIELCNIRKNIKYIDNWFKEFGSVANNLKFFQMDAEQSMLIEKEKELSEKLFGDVQS